MYSLVPFSNKIRSTTTFFDSENIYFNLKKKLRRNHFFGIGLYTGIIKGQLKDKKYA